MGGYGPTPEPEFFIKNLVVILVEWEKEKLPFLKLMEAIEYKKSLETVPGLAWMENGKLKKTPRAPLVHDLDLYRQFHMKNFLCIIIGC